MENLPTHGKSYFCYDDGKIRVSRQYLCVITAIIPFNNISKEEKEGWEEAVKENEHLFASETDYLLKAIVQNDVIEEQYFARTKQGGWFSFSIPLSWNVGSLLDVDGNLTKSLIQSRKEHLWWTKENKPATAELFSAEMNNLINNYTMVYGSIK